VARKLPGSKKGIFLLAAMLLACTESVFAQNPPGLCPQQRSTVKAPDEFYALENPQRSSPERIAVGRRLYEKGAAPACQLCHGLKGDGKGTLASQFEPRPRNFICAEMLDEIPDGQLFWIIRNGSADTGMPAYPKLSDRSIWRIILYLRTLAKPN
jgi:mono/diheme cytochrome c family protein